MQIGDLRNEHIGKRVTAKHMDIQGWLPHLLLSGFCHGVDTTVLNFSWNNDPNPANTKRGEFAIGVTVASDLECVVEDEPIYVVVINPDDEDRVANLRRLIAKQPMTQNVSFDAIQNALREFLQEENNG